MIYGKVVWYKVAYLEYATCNNLVLFWVLTLLVWDFLLRMCIYIWAEDLNQYGSYPLGFSQTTLDL